MMSSTPAPRAVFDGGVIVRATLSTALLLGAILCVPACHEAPSVEKETPAATPAAVADKPFVANGKINVDLDGGQYEIKAADDDHIRVATSSTTAAVDVTINGSQADVKIKNTPHSNFRAIVEVPLATDLVIHLSGGELNVDAITGNKDVESIAGNVRIAVADASQYASVDAAVKAGDLDARPFGGSKSGLLQEFTWSGTGKYTLRAHLGAGNLVLAGK
jgi:hypothetical protein